MLTTKIEGKVIEMYNSIDELPVLRFHKYNKMLLIDSGIGSDLNDLNMKIEKTILLCKSKPDYAVKELDNIRQLIYFIMSEVSPKHLAFCALVAKIDGKPFNDLSDEGLKNTLEVLKEVTHKDLTAQNDAVKKKISEELRIYFPGVFEDTDLKEYFDTLKRRAVLMLDEIITGVNNTEPLDALTLQLVSYSSPLMFRGSDSVEVQYDRQFENLCLILSQKLNVRPKDFTVLEFYNAFEYIKKLNKQKNG